MNQTELTVRPLISQCESETTFYEGLTEDLGDLSNKIIKIKWLRYFFSAMILTFNLTSIICLSPVLKRRKMYRQNTRVLSHQQLFPLKLRNP
jgi:hypothetical protein